MKKQAFTLAEVLITLAIIGVVAAISIPSVVANTQQKEFQTGLRKAVSVLNSAITMNMAIDGESPYENKALYYYLQRHMSVMRSMVLAQYAAGTSYQNAAFYTTDGMRFEFADNGSNQNLRLYENPEIKLRYGANVHGINKETIDYFNQCAKPNGTIFSCSYCGSYGLANNTDETVNPPCLVVVDVNGDRKPFPKNAACFNSSCKADNKRSFGDPTGTKLSDTFSIMITDKQAIPYGVVSQRAMYQAQRGENK